MPVSRQERSKSYPLVMTAVMAAVLAVISPVVLPIGPVPISLCTLAIWVTVYVLGWRRGTVAVLVYVLLGAAGMPVLAGFTGGLGRLLGPTGGYILGYLPLAAISGLFVERWRDNRLLHLIGMVLGSGVLYVLGTAWYCVQAETTLMGALVVCVLPVLPGDLMKLASALAIGPVIRRRLEKAGLCPGSVVN